MRLTNIDAVKVLGLICLYVSHSSLLQAYPDVNNALQAFLDTAFMFFAGYFCMKSLAKRGFDIKRFWQDKLKTFLIPFWLIVIIWYIVQREIERPAIAYFAYAAGLRFLELPASWNLFSLWFASILISYYVLYSLLGKRAGMVSLLLCLLGAIYYALTPNMVFSWEFFRYLLPFTIGYAWPFGFSDRRFLIGAFALFLPLGAISVPPMGHLGTFIWIAVNAIKDLAFSLGLTLASLYVFGHIRNERAIALIAWISAGSLVIYLMEPIISMYTGWLLYPAYIGNTSVQFVMTPYESIPRIVVSILISFGLCPIAQSTMGYILHRNIRLHLRPSLLRHKL